MLKIKSRDTISLRANILTKMNVEKITQFMAAGTKRDVY